LPFPAALIHKEVDFQFWGVKLKFYLSQSLFSSFDIDQGSKLLLKTIAQQLDPAHWKLLIDVGCGTGVIGLALKKKFPHLKLLGLDRNAPAVAFSRINALLNQLDQNTTFCGTLGVKDFLTCGADCLVSNLPAKAGAPVLERLLTDLLQAHAEKGLVVIVIVQSRGWGFGTTHAQFKGGGPFKEENQNHSFFLLMKELKPGSE
jgi:16S rRNA G1207 methylase RsmC